MIQSELARVVLNTYSVNIELGGKWFNVKMPSILVIAELYTHWGEIEETEDFWEVVNYKENLLEGFKVLIKPKWWQKHKLNKALKKATLKELWDAYIECQKIIGGDYFFQIASSISNAKTMIAKQKS